MSNELTTAYFLMHLLRFFLIEIFNTLQHQMIKGVNLRSLEIGDFKKGFLELLSQLTTVGNEPTEVYEKQFLKNSKNPNHYTCVGEKDGKIVCTATLLIEDKYIHGCKSCGHIEDVAVDSSLRRSGVGKKMITQLISHAKDRGCYKVILDCDDHNIPFYNSCGMKKHSNEMAIYLD